MANEVIDLQTNPIGWGIDMYYYYLCPKRNRLAFIWGPRSEVFHLTERVPQGLSSIRYVSAGETFPIPVNTKKSYMSLDEIEEVLLLNLYYMYGNTTN